MIVTVTLNPSLDEWIRLPALRLGALNRAAAFVRYPGGKGINVSRVVHELGGATIAYTLAGGDDGVILCAAMEQLGVPHRCVMIRKGTTRNNYKIQTEHPRALTEVNTAGPPVGSHTLMKLQRMLLRHRPRPRSVVLSGSLPPEVPVTIYARWIRALRQRGILTALDASGAALRHGLRAQPWLVKPNRQETEELLGMGLTDNRAVWNAVQRLAASRAQIVLLSLGAGGAVMATADGVWRAKAPTVRVDSPVGAGDSMVAGFVLGWTRRGHLLEALRLGVAAGSASVMTPGTELCHRADVARLRPRVVIRRLA